MLKIYIFFFNKVYTELLSLFNIYLYKNVLSMIRYSKKNINLKILNKITMYQMILTKSFSIGEHFITMQVLQKLKLKKYNSVKKRKRTIFKTIK